MKQVYNNPIVTYDEIVDALKSILECSLTSNYMDDFNYLNVKYEPLTDKNIDKREEKLLYDAIKSLEKNLESSSKIIRNNLLNELSSVENSIFEIETDYLINNERRKLSAQDSFIQKLKNKSLPIDILYKAPLNEEIYQNDLTDVDTNKIFSDFEKKVISDFPNFFEENYEIPKESYLDLTDLIIDDIKIKEETPKTEIKNKDRLTLLKGAIARAKKIGNKELIDKLEKAYKDELNKK